MRASSTTTTSTSSPLQAAIDLLDLAFAEQRRGGDPPNMRQHRLADFQVQGFGQAGRLGQALLEVIAGRRSAAGPGGPRWPSGLSPAALCPDPGLYRSIDVLIGRRLVQLHRLRRHDGGDGMLINELRLPIAPQKHAEISSNQATTPCSFTPFTR